MEKNLVQQVLKQVSELSDEDRVSFLMKLPSELTQDDLDKDTPSSMSRRTKAAVSWLQCNYEEDDSQSVHKQDIYDLYKEDCAVTGQLPISGTNFGKIIKMVFPSIYNRRLGQRGQSKHCYWGMKRKDSTKEVSKYEAFHCFTEMLPAQRTKDNRDMYQLSCQLVCEWASQLLDKPFSDIKSLSEYLISIGLSCGKTAALFTMMSGSTSPPKLSTDKKTLSTRLVQRRLQHNEIIRKHKDLIKQQLKLKREQQTALVHQKNIPVVSEQMSGQSMILSSQGTTTMPRPLSVQPYVMDPLSCKDSQSASVFSVSASSVKTPSLEVKTQIMHPKLLVMPSPVQTKRCQSTSLVEKHLVFPYNLAEPIADEHTLKSFQAGAEEKHSVWSNSQNQDQPRKQTLLFSTLDATSRSPSISPITTTVVGCSVRNISRLIESPAPHPAVVQYQNKRNGDDISNEEEAFIKKRCTTSIGVENEIKLLKPSGQDDFTLIRPYSCPISLLDSPKKRRENLTKTPLDLKTVESLKIDKSNTKAKQHSAQSEDTSKEAISYHFVQKPQVISRPESSVLRSDTNRQADTNALKDPTGKTRYNILNSLLSSDCDMKLADKLVQPLSQPHSLTARDQVPHLRRISYSSHSNDTNGFRSAFVPVTSQKQSTSSPTFSESFQMKLASEKECSRAIGIFTPDRQSGDKNDNKSTESGGKSNIIVRAKKQENDFSSLFSSTTSSSSSSSTLCQSGDSVVSVVDSAFATPTPTTGNQKMATASALASLSKVSSFSIAPAWLASANSNSDSFSAGSPNLTPKKTTKNRFTPIRPKLDGCLNVSPQKPRASSTQPSPQKRDMRPVHTILQEHRVKNAQDLLASLAHNYQAELGQQTVCNASPSSLMVSFETPLSESIKSAQPGAAMNVVSSLPLQNVTLKEATDKFINQSQTSLALSNSSLTGESQMFVLPSPSHKGAACKLGPILLQDNKGNQYSVDKQPAGTLIVEQDLLHLNDKQGGSEQSLFDLNSNQAHVIGPDAKGQTYLLVPNSDQTLCQVRSKSCVPVSSALESSILPINPSTSLTSLLSSNIKNTLNGDDTKSSISEQALIQHRTTPSAFHKCSPIGSTSKPTGAYSPKVDVGVTFVKVKQNKESGCTLNEPPDSRDEVTMDDAFSNHATGTNVSLTNQIDKPSTLLKDILDCPPETVCKSTHGSQCSSEEVKTTNAPITSGKINPNTAGKEEGLVSLLSLNEVANTPVPQMPQLVLRKRKAATSDNPGCEGKKRTEGENMENIEPPHKIETHETEDIAMEKQVLSVPKEDNESPLHIQPMKMVPLTNSSTNQTDTETLLNMMGDTKSMTVKEVVKALNKLRTKMNVNQGKDLKPPLASDGAQEALSSEVSEAAMSTSLTRGSSKEKVDPPRMSGSMPLHSLRTNQRNISLNLESLEIDALLDLEPNLDCQLVGDMKEQDVFKLGQTVGRRASIGTAHIYKEDTLQSSKKIKRNKSKSLKKTDLLCAHTEQHKDESPASTRTINSEAKLKPYTLDITHPHHPSTTTPAIEKSKSCVQDILERGVAFKRDDVAQHFSSVVGLSSKSCNPESKNNSLGNNRDLILCENSSYLMNVEGEKSCSQQNKAPEHSVERRTKAYLESDLPLDVIDFITESMSDDTSYHPQLSQNSLSSWLIDFDRSANSSDPMREINCNKSSASTPLFSAASAPSQEDKKGWEKDQSILLLDVNNDDHTFSHEENNGNQPVGTVSAACTFLSPTGPARPVRRPSMERIISGEKNVSRISSELSRPPSRLKTRAETPIENFSSTTCEIVVGKPSVLKKDLFSVRDHTTAVMLQQPVKSRVPSQLSGDLLPDTCLSSFVRQGSAELCRADRALTETPVSDPGYSSVGQTPVSEVGGSSVSPSPVMMAMDSTFRPVKSESEGNQINIDNFSHSSDSNSCLTYQVLAPTVSDQRIDIQVLSENNQAADNNLSSEAGLICKSPNESSSSISNLHDTLCTLSELDHLMSIRLQSIPTPPSSPSGSPLPPRQTINPSLPLVSQAQPKLKVKGNISSPFVAPTCPSNSLLSSTSSSPMCKPNVTTNGSGLMTNPELVSPALVTRFSPSPHLSMRPSCSPYQHYSHPSPPFTPSSQRCPTPSSLAITSRSNTPAMESLAAPNRFMPIQTSGILATSVTVTQTYIQPIKPVVTLASFASHKSISFKDPILPDYPSSLPVPNRSVKSITKSQQLSNDLNRGLAKTNTLVPSKLNRPVSKRHSSKKTSQDFSKKLVSLTSSPSTDLRPCQEHSKPSDNSNPKPNQPALVLSLGGNIGSVSLSSQGISLRNTPQQSGVLPSYKEAVSNKAESGRYQSHNLPCYHETQERHEVEEGDCFTPGVLNGSKAELPSQFTMCDTQLPEQQNFIEISSQSLGDQRYSGTQQCSATDIQGALSAENKWANGERTERGAGIYTSSFNMSHTPDDLEETLDVLKILDSQYFDQEEDYSSSTSL